MNKMVRKLKKSNKALRFLYYLVMIFYVVGLVLFIKSLLSLTGVETMIRTIVIIFFIIYFLLYSFINLLNLLRRKYKGVIISTIFSLLFILIFLVGSYYINYVYNNLNEPIWIANNVNFTVKTQFVNRIRKGLLDNLYDSIQVNEKFMDKSALIPYSNMVYFGDGFTDVPCMKVVSMNGGNSICVYTPKNKANAEHTLENGRATHIAPADYTENGRVDKICKNILEEIALTLSR